MLFYLMVFLLPFFAVSPWQKLFGVPVGFIYSGVVMLTLIGWLWEHRFRGLGRRIFGTPLMVGLLTFLLINLVSILLTGSYQKENLVRFLYLAFSISVFWLTTNAVQDRDTLFKALNLFIIGSFLASLYGIYETGGFLLGFDTGQEITWTVPRLYGTATEPQVFGNLLVAAITLAAGLFLVRGNSESHRYGVFLIFMILAMVMTFSAGGWVGVIIAVGLLLLVYKWLSLKRVFALLLMIGVVGLGVTAIDKYLYPGYLQGFPSLFVKFTDQSSQEAQGTHKLSAISREDRVWFRAAAWKMFEDNPVLGVGTGNFGYLYNQYRPGDAPEVDFVAKAHNQYLEILAETGVIGFGIFLVVVVQLIMVVWRGLLARDDRLLKMATWALLASLVGLGVHGYAFGILVHNYIWVILGLTCAAAKLPLAEGEGYSFENRYSYRLVNPDGRS